MSADWFPSVVLAIWHPDGIGVTALSELRSGFLGSGVRYAEYLQPNWFVVVLDDLPLSREQIEEFETKIFSTNSLRGALVGHAYGTVLMDLDANGVSRIRPTGKPMHEAMKKAQHAIARKPGTDHD